MADFQDNNVSRNLKEYFSKNGLTQQTVANMLGITQAAVSSLLRGKPFGKKSAKIWSDLFGFNYSWLLTGEGEMFKTTEKVIIEHTTPDMIKEAASEAFEHQLNKLFKDKIIAPYSLIEEKEEEIRKLNREIGRLEADNERLREEYKSYNQKITSSQGAPNLHNPPVSIVDNLVKHAEANPQRIQVFKAQPMTEGEDNRPHYNKNDLPFIEIPPEEEKNRG